MKFILAGALVTLIFGIFCYIIGGVLSLRKAEPYEGVQRVLLGVGVLLGILGILVAFYFIGAGSLEILYNIRGQE
jgi:hypothetical protein